MKAVIITSHGEPSVLQLQERAQPKIGSDEVLIQVKAAGVNRPMFLNEKDIILPRRGLRRIYRAWKWLELLQQLVIMLHDGKPVTGFVHWLQEVAMQNM